MSYPGPCRAVSLATVPFRNVSIAQKCFFSHRSRHFIVVNAFSDITCLGTRVKRLKARVIWGKKEHAKTINRKQPVLVEIARSFDPFNTELLPLKKPTLVRDPDGRKKDNGEISLRRGRKIMARDP